MNPRDLARRLRAESMLREMARRRLSGFLRYRFHAERRPLLWSWHLDFLSEILEAVTLRQIKRVIINIPPRFLKSELVSQTWHAWMIGREDSPRSSMLSAGATAQLAERDSRKTLQIIQSEWYKAVFPKVEIAREAVAEWETRGLATRNAAGAGGTITGRGGQHLLWDDLLLADEAMSETIRTKKNEWLGETFRSRLDDQKEGTITGIMQRLHEEDPTGFLVKKMRNPDADQYLNIVIPLIAPKRTMVVMPKECGGRLLKVREAGDLLHPDRIGLKEAKALKAAMGVNFSGQYQQEPSKQEGDMLRPSRIVEIEGQALELAKKWGLRPNLYGDLASKEKQTQKDDPDRTVFAVMAVDELRRIWILDLWAERAAPDTVVDTLIALVKKWEPVRRKVEEGQMLNYLLTMLAERCKRRGDSPIWIEGLKPSKDKITRALPLQNFLNTGQICVPAGASWLNDLKDEMRKFPRGAHDDRVDAVAYGVADLGDIRQGTARRDSKDATDEMLRQADQKAIRKALEKAATARRSGGDPIAASRVVR